MPVECDQVSPPYCGLAGQEMVGLFSLKSGRPPLAWSHVGLVSEPELEYMGVSTLRGGPCLSRKYSAIRSHAGFDKRSRLVTDLAAGRRARGPQIGARRR